MNPALQASAWILSVLVSSALSATEPSECMIGPDDTDARETKIAPGVARGTVQEFAMNKKDEGYEYRPVFAKGAGHTRRPGHPTNPSRRP